MTTRCDSANALRSRKARSFQQVGTGFAIAACLVATACGGGMDTSKTLSSVEQSLTTANCFQFPLPQWVQVGYGFGDDWTCCAQCPAGTYKRHTGIDVKANAGDAVYAAADGTVHDYLQFFFGCCNQWEILLQHTMPDGSTVITGYHHVNGPSAGPAVGATVAKGQQINTVFNNGTNTHLHFQVWQAAYSDLAHRGALPKSACAGDPPFPSSYVDPTAFVNAHSSCINCGGVPNNGAYCGTSFMTPPQSPDALISCTLGTDGIYHGTLAQQCAPNTCRSQTGWPGGAYCAPNCGSLTVGWWCGYNLGNANSNYVYHCTGRGGAPDITETCPGACTNGGTNKPDFCTPAHDPGYGWWCGNDRAGGYASTLYYFATTNLNSATSAQHCANSCVTCPGPTICHGYYNDRCDSYGVISP